MNEDLLRDWATAETAAIKAEIDLAKMGHAASDSAARGLVQRLSELRAEADRLFRLLPKDRYT